ncbi:MAG TPA: hypothetical protein ENN17_07315 [bacterium]|nr:hypothetical protein [bacterium]
MQLKLHSTWLSAFRAFVLLSGLLILPVCDIDHGIAPLPGKLSVQVFFLNKEVPEQTQGVYLFVAPVFPPHAINELFLSPNSIPLDNDTVMAEIVLPYGHYEAVGLWWYSTLTESNLADVFTLKLGPDFLPYQFDITPEKPHHEIELFANLDRVNRESSLEGTITFNGPFPPNTLATAVAAFQHVPQRDVEYYVWLESIDFSVDSNPFHFRLPVRSRRRIRYIAVFWLGEKMGLHELRMLGFYENPDVPGTPGEFLPRTGETLTGVDIQADWAKAVR